jgi:hypothetical protein
VKIIAIDPGAETGWAKWEEGDITFGQFGPNWHYETLWLFLAREAPDVLIVERFSIEPNPAVLTISAEYIGVCKLYAEARRGKCEFVPQTRTQKEWWSNGKLQRVGLECKGQPHAKDAVRHVLYYLTSKLHRREYIDQLR